MTREALILDLCPTDCIGKKCETYDCEDVCYPMLRIMFDKYDKQIRADAIDEIAKIIIPITKCKEGCKAMEIECSHCMAEKLDHIENQMNCFLEQLKEKKDEN